MKSDKETTICPPHMISSYVLTSSIANRQRATSDHCHGQVNREKFLLTFKTLVMNCDI